MAGNGTGRTLIGPSGESELEDKVERKAVVSIAPELLLEWLQFKGGKIAQVRLSWAGNIDVLIEHKDMPDCRQGEPPDVVEPIYMVTEPGHVVTRTAPLRED